MNKMITDEIVTKENAAAVKSRLVQEAALASGQHWLAISFCFDRRRGVLAEP
jgi:hypothetical protein